MANLFLLIQYADWNGNILIPVDGKEHNEFVGTLNDDGSVTVSKHYKRYINEDTRWGTSTTKRDVRVEFVDVSKTIPSIGQTVKISFSHLYYNFSNGVQNKSDSASITLVGENGAKAALHENKTVFATKFERDIDEGYIASLVLLKEDELLKQAVETVLKMEIEKKNEKRHYSYYSALEYIYENGIGVNKDEDKAFAYACLSMDLSLVMPFFKSGKRKYPGDDLVAPVERDSPKYYLLGKTLLNDGLKEYGEKLIEMGAKNIDFEEGDYTPRGDHQPHKINNELEKHYQMLLHQEFANICFNRITVKPNGYDIGDLVVHYACYLAYKIYGHDKMINYPTSEMDGDPYDHTWDDVQKTDFFEAYRFLKKCGEEGDEFAKLVVSIYDSK